MANCSRALQRIRSEREGAECSRHVPGTDQAPNALGAVITAELSKRATRVQVLLEVETK